MEDEILTLEALHGIQTDPEAETKVAQALGVPQGTYNSQPALTMRLQTADDDAQHPGRKSANFYGFFRGVGVIEGDGDEKTLMNPQPAGRAAFTVSWEYQDGVDFETKEVKVGKPDLQSKLWFQACKVYRQANQLAPKAVVQVPDVLTYLEKYSVAVRFIYLDGRDEPLAVAISRAKEV